MKKRSYELPMPNREYKDTIFRWIFSIIENLLSLYNAVTGKNYQNPEDLDIVTLENAIYMGMKNDLAFKNKIIRLEDPEVMNAMQKKYGTR